MKYFEDISFTRRVLWGSIVLSSLGLGASIAAHLLALVQTPIPGGKQGIALLMTGAFAAALPVYYFMQCWNESRGRTGRAINSIDLSGCSRWVKRGLFVLFVYFLVAGIESRNMYARAIEEREVLLASQFGFSAVAMLFYYGTLAAAASLLMLYRRKGQF